MIHPHPTPLRPEGVLDDIAARKKLQRLALRLGTGDQGVSGLRLTGELLPEGGAAARLEFSLRGYRIDRRLAVRQTEAGNMQALVRWFESRVRSIERGVDSLDEAFAGDLADRPATPEARPPYAGGYHGALSVEECIDLMRAALARLGIAERDVRVTWDGLAGWARLRLRLPSAQVLDKHVAVDPAKGRGELALVLLALWLRDRARGYGEGWERPILAELFAGHLHPEQGALEPREA
jgi:hypothetical protein